MSYYGDLFANAEQYAFDDADQRELEELVITIDEYLGEIGAAADIGDVVPVDDARTLTLLAFAAGRYFQADITPQPDTPDTVAEKLKAIRLVVDFLTTE